MQSIQIISVGKLKESYLRDACAEYVKRLQAFCKLQITELSEVRLPESPNPAQIAAALAAEGAEMRRRLPQSGYTVALCIEGKALSSEGLSERLSAAALAGKSTATFLIGSSHGLPPDIKAEADLCLSMSAMTFPHQLARLMLLEQVYRAFQISTGGKYHK